MHIGNLWNLRNLCQKCGYANTKCFQLLRKHVDVFVLIQKRTKGVKTYKIPFITALILFSAEAEATLLRFRDFLYFAFVFFLSDFVQNLFLHVFRKLNVIQETV